MPRIRAAAVTLALCLAAAWGAGPGGRPSTPASGQPVAAKRMGGGLVRVPVAGRPPRPGAAWFLTIGDSITFGYTSNPALAGTNISWALQLQRMLAAEGRDWSLYDVACPSETTLSYATACPGRRQVPLLAHRSQRAAALAAITAEGAGLRLIVVALGSNDLLGAIRDDPRVTATALVAHLEDILDELHGDAPGVPIVVAGMYDPFALGAPRTDTVLAGIDGAVDDLATGLGDGYADWHAAINHPTDGTPLCQLVDCADLDIHPTQAGQKRLAQAVMEAIPPPA